jgi:segregation and condensation protein B
MSIKAKIEAIIYAAEEPVAWEQILALAAEEAQQQLAQQQQAGDESEHVSTGVPEAESIAASVEPVTSDAATKSLIRAALQELLADYSHPDHGIEIRQIAGGYRMATKPEQHEVVRAFAKSLKPPIRLSLQALETLAVIAYKQPVTAPEISEIRGVDSGGVLGTLLDRKLITTAGRKQVIGRPILYKTTKDFLLRFGLKDLSELPSMEEFEKLAAESLGADLFTSPVSEEAAAPAVATEASAPPVTEPDTDTVVQPDSQPPSAAEEETHTALETPSTEPGE